MKLIKLYFKFLDTFFPSLSAKQMYRHMSNPRTHKLRKFEDEILSRSEQKEIEFRGFVIRSYEWGPESEKVALLVHGWEGQAGNFGAIVDILLSKGYHVIAFDGPSHGKSSRGPTSMFEYGDFISEVLQRCKPTSIISHSFGTVATIWGLTKSPEVSIDQWFIVTTPANFKDRIDDTKDLLGVSDRTIMRLIELVEGTEGYSVDLLNMDEFGSKLVTVDKVIIIHSRSDKVIPIEDAKITHRAIKGSKMIELEDIGHYKILWSEELKELLTEHLK